MLAQIYELVRKMEEKINGTPKIYIHIKGNTLVLRCEWLLHGQLLRLEEALSVIDLINFKGEEGFMLEVFVAKANQSYRKEIREMIKELQDAAKT